MLGADGLGDIGRGKWKKTIEKVNIDDIISLDDKSIRLHILGGRVNKKVHPGKQGKHIKGHNNFIEGRSYLTITEDDIQELVNRYAGMGIIRRTKTEKWDKKEVITSDKNVGFCVDEETQEEKATKSFKIHYSKSGIHIVPRKEET